MTAVVLASGLVFHGVIVRRSWLHLTLVMEDGSIARVRRSAVLALVTPPALPVQQPDVEPAGTPQGDQETRQ